MAFAVNGDDTSPDCRPALSAGLPSAHPGYALNILGSCIWLRTSGVRLLRLIPQRPLPGPFCATS